ncbi:MAG: AAA family ATPase [Sulfurimonas sp.]|nr:MAG: AAA family ATPase [Sulfurimonas sp.]
MQNNIYHDSQKVFLDTVIVDDYIQFDKVSAIYQSLLYSIKKPLKMILIYGKPGTGKSMFLSKLYKDSKNQQKMYLYSTPILDESEFFKTLAQDLLGVNYNGELNFTQFMRTLEGRKINLNNDIPLILLDEAQLYSDSLMEKIRLLSDTRAVKFIIALHKTKEEDLIAKEHFQTRIWESIELENSSVNELSIYIQNKLKKEKCFNSAAMFDKKSVKLIYKITKGNYRDTNKLLYSLFDIYIYYAQNNPSKIAKNTISNTIIEMAAIHTGLINA